MNPKPKNVHAQYLGRLGGRAGRGACKARSTEQARAAVAVRWASVEQTCKAHQEADRACGRKWECACGACNIIRNRHKQLNQSTL